MPYPNEHACRLREPGEFQGDSFRREERESDGKKYSCILGKLKGEDSMTEQAYRYPKETWSEEEARGHCQAHHGKTFEPASEKKEGSKLGIYRGITNRPLGMALENVYELLAALDSFPLKSMWDTDDLFPENPENAIKRTGNIAVVPISGVLTQKMSFWSVFLGETSTEVIGEQIQSLLADDSVEQIILDIDSPGGEVCGIENLSNLIFEGRQSKRILACVNSMANSGAYWLASAATEVVMSSKTAIAGSIGVVEVHRDWSIYEQQMGIKTTEIVAGKYKRIASNVMPLSQEGKQTLQDRVDYIYSMFVADVARNRGVDEKNVLDKMADGRIFIGQQAVDAGLADRIADMSTLFTIGEKNVAMDLSKLKAEFPEVYSEAVKIGRAEATAENAKAIDAARAEGISIERTRVIGIIDMLDKAKASGIIDVKTGFETAKAQAIRDGSTIESFAVAIMQGRIERDKGESAAPATAKSIPGLYAESPKVKGGFEMSEEEKMKGSIKSAVHFANRS